MKKIKLLIIPVLASAATLVTGLTTAVSCSHNNNNIVINDNEIEQKAMSSGLAIYSFDFKGNTLPDSRRFVNIQLTEISIKSDSEVKSVSVLNIIGKDDIVIHDDGHFDVPITFIDPYQFSGNTTVKFQLKFRYRLSGTNVEEIVENLVIKYYNSIPAPSDTAIFKLGGRPTYDPTKYEEGLFIDVPVKLIKDRDGYPFLVDHIKSIECTNRHIMARSSTLVQLPDTFVLSLVCNYAPVYDHHFDFNIYIKYEGANGVEKTTTFYGISFDYHPPIFTKGEVLLVSSSGQQVGQKFEVSYKYVDPIVTSRSVRPISYALLYDPKTGVKINGISVSAPNKTEQFRDGAYPFKITVTIDDPTQPLDLTFGLCISINSTRCIADSLFTFTYIPEQP